MTSKEYQEGYDAHVMGVDVKDCPYHMMPALWREWEAGWTEAYYVWQGKAGRG